METLRDVGGRVVGMLQKTGSTTKLMNAVGRVLGWYDTKTNKTFDVSGRVLGMGNILTSLLR